LQWRSRQPPQPGSGRANARRSSEAAVPFTSQVSSAKKAGRSRGSFPTILTSSPCYSRSCDTSSSCRCER
jgi:hypothetical protein